MAMRASRGESIAQIRTEVVAAVRQKQRKQKSASMLICSKRD